MEIQRTSCNADLFDPNILKGRELVAKAKAQSPYVSGHAVTDQMLADSGFPQQIQQELSRNAWTQQNRIGGRFIDCLRSEINALRNLGLDDYRHAWDDTRTWRSSR